MQASQCKRHLQIRILQQRSCSIPLEDDSNLEPIEGGNVTMNLDGKLFRFIDKITYCIAWVVLIGYKLVMFIPRGFRWNGNRGCEAHETNQ